MRFRKALGLAALFLLASQGAEAGNATVGWVQSAPGAFVGYTIFSPSQSNNAYLVDSYGRMVNTWTTNYRPGNAVYLMEDGNLLRAAKPNGGLPPISAGGYGGIVQILDWDSNVLWEYDYSSSVVNAHHDVEPLPNGNILILAWELKTGAEAIAAGRNPALLTEGELWPEHIIEVTPTGPTTGNIVWEWHLWDHLIQDFDASMANFGVVADHPELVNINAAQNGAADWIHANSIDYNPELDQIVISANRLDEIWIIDHSTTTAEAAGHTGGAQGRGGDILYRWGNPQHYGAGLPSDQRLYNQHCVEWVPTGFPGAGNITIFNNGNDRPGGPFTTIDEITTPVDMSGGYPSLAPGSAFGPTALTWTYQDPVPTNFFSSFISGVRRLPNGNTVICNGPQGRFFEVNDAGERVWGYNNPITAGGAAQQGDLIASSCFRTNRYPASYPGLAGRDLTPGAPLETYPMQFDYNDDGSVGIVDFNCFSDTFTGSCAAPCDPIYEDAIGFLGDADSDGDVDCDDWDAFLAVYVGAPVALPDCEGNFIRGDTTGDNLIDIADAVRGLGYLFGSDPIDCLQSLDINDDEQTDISDPVYLLSALFGGGAPVPAPVACGLDPTPGSLSCVTSTCP